MAGAAAASANGGGRTDAGRSTGSLSGGSSAGSVPAAAAPSRFSTATASSSSSGTSTASGARSSTPTATAAGESSSSIGGSSGDDPGRRMGSSTAQRSSVVHSSVDARSSAPTAGGSSSSGSSSGGGDYGGRVRNSATHSSAAAAGAAGATAAAADRGGSGGGRITSSGSSVSLADLLPAQRSSSLPLVSSLNWAAVAGSHPAFVAVPATNPSHRDVYAPPKAGRQKLSGNLRAVRPAKHSGVSSSSPSAGFVPAGACEEHAPIAQAGESEDGNEPVVPSPKLTWLATRGGAAALAGNNWLFQDYLFWPALPGLIFNLGMFLAGREPRLHRTSHSSADEKVVAVSSSLPALDFIASRVITAEKISVKHGEVLSASAAHPLVRLMMRDGACISPYCLKTFPSPAADCRSNSTSTAESAGDVSEWGSRPQLEQGCQGIVSTYTPATISSPLPPSTELLPIAHFTTSLDGERSTAYTVCFPLGNPGIVIVSHALAHGSGSSESCPVVSNMAACFKAANARLSTKMKAQPAPSALGLGGSGGGMDLECSDTDLSSEVKTGSASSDSAPRHVWAVGNASKADVTSSVHTGPDGRLWKFTASSESQAVFLHERSQEDGRSKSDILSRHSAADTRAKICSWISGLPQESAIASALPQLSKAGGTLSAIGPANT